MKYLILLFVLVNVKLILGNESNFNKNKFFNNKDARFIKAQQVTTFTDYVFSTKTIFPQCVSSVVTASPCMGRKKRRMKRVAVDNVDLDNSESNKDFKVESSIDSTGKQNESSDRQGKFGGFTIWTTTRTTATATVKFTNTSTTLSLIYVCTGGNVEFPSPFSCLSG